MSRYYAGAAGRCYFYASKATMRCPYAQEAPGWLIGQAHGAAEDGIDLRGVDLDKVFKRAHRSSVNIDADGKTCADCGATLEKVGYRTWVEAPLEQVVAEHHRLGTHPPMYPYGTHGRMPGSTRYFTLKRDAIAFQREQAQIDRAAAREEVTS